MTTTTSTTQELETEEVQENGHRDRCNPPPPTGTPTRRTDLEVTAVEAARAAILAGDKTAALAAVDNILTESKLIHDFYGDWVASILTYIGKRHGERAVKKAIVYSGGDVWDPIIKFFAQTNDTAGLASTFHAFLVSHRYDYQAFEYSDRYVFEISRCSSGERLIREGKVKHYNQFSGPHFEGTSSQNFSWAPDVDEVPFYDIHWSWMTPEYTRKLGWAILDVDYGPREDGVPAIKKIIVFKNPVCQ